LLIIINLLCCEEILFPIEMKQFLLNKQELPQSVLFLSLEEMMLYEMEVNYEQGITLPHKYPLLVYDFDLIPYIGLYQITEWVQQSQIAGEEWYGKIVVDFPSKLGYYLGNEESSLELIAFQEPFTEVSGLFISQVSFQELYSRTNYIIISEHLYLVTLSQLEQSVQNFQQSFHDWRSQWEEQKINEYLQYYSTEFYSKTTEQNLSQWSTQKSIIFNLTNQIRVSFQNQEFIFQDDTIYFEAEQNYQNNDYHDYGIKSMIWKFIDDFWYIWAEDWEKILPPLEEEPRPTPEETLDPEGAFLEKQADDFDDTFNNWQKAWLYQNIEEYLQFYSPHFISETAKQDYTTWKNYKTLLFKMNQKVLIEFSEYQQSIIDNQITMEFIQIYQAGSYHDYGKKSMIWVKEEGQWKIIKEEWYAMVKPNDPPSPPSIVIKPPQADLITSRWLEKKGLVPYEYLNFLFSGTENYGPYLIIVEKSTQQAALYSLPNEVETMELLKTYHISTGQNRGNKSRRGDNKTPEGLYVTIEWIPAQKLEAKYGSGAFVLNYPNLLDKLRGKTGSGIWIHGSNIDMVPNDTEGCIRFENQEITFFYEQLNFNTIPVIICETIEWKDLNSLQQEKEKIITFIQEWLDSWEKQDINQYLGFYDEQIFISKKQKMNGEQWKKHKQKVLAKNLNLKIYLLEFNYYYADNNLMITFYQDYIADNLKSYGFKNLVLKRSEHSWKIIQEEWTPSKRKDVVIKMGEENAQ